MLQYLTGHPTAFDPDTIQILNDALDAEWQIARANRIAFELDHNLEMAREVLAKHIVDMALQGERDPQRLVSGALDRPKL